MPTVHARLSPSASTIWLTCPGAIPLIERLQLKDTGSSIYADRGTAAHSVMEMCLTDGREPASFIGTKIEASPGVLITIDMELAGMVKQAVDYVRSFDKADIIFCEEKVEVNHEHGVFGTIDVVAIHVTEGVLEIVDLKTGRTPVEAVRNSQLSIYAIGAYREFGKALGIDRFRVTIIQPPVYDLPQSYDFDLQELLSFEAGMLEAVVRTQTHKDTFVPSEKACRWCRARHVCPAQKQLMNELAAVDFTGINDSTPDDDLAEMFAKADAVEMTIKAIRAEVTRRLLSGVPVKGYRLAPGSTTRSWDPDQVTRLEQSLSALFDPSVYMTEPHLKSPAQVERALKGEDTHFDITEFLEKKTAHPVVVHETSQKPLWSSNDAARQDFAVYKTDLEV